MVQERPKSEKDINSSILKSLNSDKKFRLLMDGLVHPSPELREISISRIKLYNKYDENLLNKFLIKKLNDEKDYIIDIISIIGLIKNPSNVIIQLMKEIETSKSEKVKERSTTIIGNLVFESDIEGNLIEKISTLLKNTLYSFFPKDDKKNDDKKIKRSTEVNNLIKAIAITLYKISTRGDKEIIEIYLKMINDYQLRDVAAKGLGLIGMPIFKNKEKLEIPN
jgi:hypothetical protein